MSSATRLLISIVLCIILLTGGTLFAATTAATVSVYRAGMVGVSVDQQGGDHVTIALPAILLDLATSFVPGEVYEEIAREAGPYWPAVEQLSQELTDCPDVTFVEVVDGSDHVSIAKRGRYMVIDIESGSDDIHVSVPLRTFTRLVDRVSNHI